MSSRDLTVDECSLCGGIWSGTLFGPVGNLCWAYVTDIIFKLNMHVGCQGHKVYCKLSAALPVIDSQHELAVNSAVKSDENSSKS